MNRRDLFNSLGLAGAAGLSPWQLQPAQPAPKRFVFIVKSNGLRPYGIMPEGYEDPGPHGPESKLDEALAGAEGEVNS